MTQVSSSFHPDSTLDNLVRLARDRSARGNATRRDWQRVAEIDPERAHRELRDFLRRTWNSEASGANPYENQPRVPGAVIGFIAGVLVMLILWVILPYARENWMERSVIRDVATGAQFLSTLAVPAGMLIGARWSRRKQEPDTTTAPALPKNASFDELLDAFEHTQNVGRARVY